MKVIVLFVLTLVACAGSDAGTDHSPEPAGGTGESGIVSDSAWTAGADSVVTALITVDGGTITLPRAFTVEIEPATVTDTQTVFVNVSRDPAGFRGVTAGEPPLWFGRVMFARSCPPKPVHVRVALARELANTDPNVVIVPHIRAGTAGTGESGDYDAVTGHTRSTDGSTVQFSISEKDFTTMRRSDKRCEAIFTIALVPR